MGVKPLAVAAVAAGLLVAVLGFDITYTRVVAVDVQAENGWATLVEQPFRYDEAPFARPGGAMTIEVNRTDEVLFRVRVDNDFPLAYAEPYVAYQAGIEVARGELTAPANAVGTAEFAVAADLLLGTPPTAREPPGKGISETWADITVQVGDDFLSAGFPLREVPRE